MTVRSIHLLGSPVLRERAVEVAAMDDEVRALVEDLLETMARRLAVAEAVPVVVELLARRAAEGGDPAPLERELETRRASLAGQPAVREALDRFLQHAGVLRETSP